ncbi:MAG: DUF2807 domain-containing protein [Flavobacteriaceae bacterium]|nr:DUF2807 domain-containing protein [Flavobacteriaceae bacterium]
MKKVLIVLVFISNLVFSQDKVSQNLGDFNVLKTYRGLHIKLVKSKDQKIVIEGEKSEEVIVKNTNGVLKITMTVLETFSADEARVTVYFNNNIDIIDVNEGSFVSSNEIFKQEKIELKSQEAGKIDIELKTNYLDVKVVSGGEIILKGFTKNQNVKANTGGFYKAKALETEYTNVTASTGATATVYASKLVDANANLGATITVKGEPTEIKKKESLGGYIRN